MHHISHVLSEVRHIADENGVVDEIDVVVDRLKQPTHLEVRDENVPRIRQLYPPVTEEEITRVKRKVDMRVALSWLLFKLEEHYSGVSFR